MIKITSKKSINLYELIENLEKIGYSRSEVLSYGNYSFRGDTIRIQQVNEKGEIRIDLFGDIIEKIMLGNREITNIDIKENIIRFKDGSKIRPGEYVVHIDHGVGIFLNIGLKKVGRKFKEYIFIEYLNNDCLYVPLKDEERVSSYIGVGKRRPKLNKLGSQTWIRTKKKTYESIILLAKELLQIYAKREVGKSKKYKIDKNWDVEIRKTFDYVETSDQEKALKDVYADLEKEKPMDRLICGDVGFGKTEIALRAAVQAIANGYQAALLCPTTILAEQHYTNIKKRFKNMPINVEVLSRFQTDKEIPEVIRGIKSGSVDLVIGTHKLLNKNIAYKNLDLLIVDEEQKFGVRQKELLKKEREEINVLTLSATPIPRTLFVSLSGIRDISQINTPPKGRKGIETRVAIKNNIDVKTYIGRELKRAGQIYYLFNNVRSIEVKRREIQKLVPKAKVEMAHGQMSALSLSKVMSEFAKGKIDVLVCSTIIGSGLDLANVNTLIVEEADKFGLSQLYQIRGRIGRSGRQAYCLLTHKDKKITSQAFTRLRSMVENAELGSGFNIALSDLEIRGGGNVLGREQHGNMESVGLVLYSKLLKKAVDKLR